MTAAAPAAAAGAALSPPGLDAMVDEMMRSLCNKLKQKRLRASDLFKMIDTSGDGSVSGEELKAGLKGLGFEPPPDQFDAMMLRMDKDGGGEVSLKEFDRALKAAEKLPPKQAVKKVEEAKPKKQGLTQEDREEIRQIFALFKQLCRHRARDDKGDIKLVDMDDSGSISVDELEQLLETVGLRLEAHELETMVKDIDLNNDGEIDFHEFCETMTKKIQVDTPPDDIAKAFKAFAKGAPEGTIRVKDLRNALRTYMHKDLIDAEVDALLVHYSDCFFKPPGQDHDYFNYQEYIDLMTPMVEQHHPE